MRIVALLLVCCLSGAMSGTAFADEAFRCGRWVVSSSLTVAELLDKCGAPTSQQSRTQDVRNAGNSGIKVGTTTIETWRYERPGALTMVVTIVDGRIKSLDRDH
jgi:Protein of unknown function (DUF2845)